MTSTSTPFYLMGLYSINPSSTQPINCIPTSAVVYTTSGQYAGCCDPSRDACIFPTSCIDDANIVREGGQLSQCASSSSCIGIRIYDSPESTTGNSFKIFFVCVIGWVASTLYRELPAQKSTSLDSITSLSKTPTITTTPPSASSVNATSSLSSNSGSHSPTLSMKDILGIIGGAVFLLVILIICWYRKKIAQYIRSKITERSKKRTAGREPLIDNDNPLEGEHEYGLYGLRT